MKKRGNKSVEEFIKRIPKAELHLHIEGTFEPELMFRIARRNDIELKYASVEELRRAYNFNNLQEFLDIYYQGAGVLIHEQDFYDLTWAYLEKAHSQNIIHTEIFFDPQTHTDRGVDLGAVINGISRALNDAQHIMDISSRLIMCLLRHMDADAAMKTLDKALEYKHLITAIGLDSAEVGNPPSRFQRVFDKARQEGFLTVAHAGEEGPSEYVWEALNLLKVSRVDHGNHSLDDDKLTKELAIRRIPLTVCPLSNLKLKVVSDMKDHPLKRMIEKGLLVTINSDDPAYFGGYVNENYMAVAEALDLSEEDILKLVLNSFKSSFADERRKQEMSDIAEQFYKNGKINN
ncbi:MAG: adenosine deaminase [Bacteroidales bacterium]|jgi:adenosine deaminase